MTCTTVLAWIWSAIVHVQFTILSLKAFGALTGIGADKVFTGSTILTRGRFAFVDLFLAVRACITLETVATMGITDVLTSSVVTKELRSYT